MNKTNPISSQKNISELIEIRLKKAGSEILDRQTLDNLRDLEEPEDEVPFLDDLIQTFCTQVPEIICSLESAFTAKSGRSIEYNSHKLKGFGRNLGALRLVEICEVIESNSAEIAKKPEKSVIRDVENEFILAKNLLQRDWENPRTQLANRSTRAAN